MRYSAYSRHTNAIFLPSYYGTWGPFFSRALYIVPHPHNSFPSRPGQTSLKHRDRGQGTESELKDKDFKRELEEREYEARAAKTRERGLGPGGSRVGLEAESRRALEGASSSKKARTESAAAPAAANLVSKTTFPKTKKMHKHLLILDNCMSLLGAHADIWPPFSGMRSHMFIHDSAPLINRYTFYILKWEHS